MKHKIFTRLCILSVAAAILSCLLIFAVMYGSFMSQMERSVQQNALVLSEVMNQTGTDEAQIKDNRVNGLRVTLIATDGSVIYDSASNTTENHANRPEVKDAFANGYGEATRTSDTLQKSTYYYALRLNSGSVLRVSSTMDSVLASAVACIPYILLVALFVGFVSMGMAHKLTQHIVDPINALDLENPLANNTYEELSPLLGRIEKQNVALTTQMKDMQRMRDDLSDIMENMSEGLIVLNSNGMVISINRSALQILDKEKDECIGQFLLALSRSDAFQTLSQAAKRGETAHSDYEHDEHIYSASLSQAEGGGSILLLVDVTERRTAETMRREFSANVSHELKTPLQTISGYAELIKNGMVPQEDQKGFVSKIYDESQRMIALIQDIINLSSLDEGGAALPREDVDLLAIANQEAQLLQEKAAHNKVTLTVSGESAHVNGVRRLLEETVYNLCDNAVSYNKEGGSAQIEVHVVAQGVQLSVQDTGIGIPTGEQQRVFERFYRVDKSHSRATGGTGLGLSIVKHAVQLHGAAMVMDSKPGVGTTITLTFPAGK